MGELRAVMRFGTHALLGIAILAFVAGAALLLGKLVYFMDQEHSEAYIVLIDAMLLLKRVAAEKAFPFEPLVLNAETVDAMRAARKGETAAVGHPSNLIASLNADR